MSTFTTNHFPLCQHHLHDIAFDARCHRRVSRMRWARRERRVTFCAEQEPLRKTTNMSNSASPPPVPKACMGTVCARTMAALRTGVGLGALFIPTITGNLVGLPTPLNTSSIIMTRLFGVRDALLGIALWSAIGQESQTCSNFTPQEARRYTRRLLWAGVLVDAVDICSVVTTSAFGGNMGVRALSVFGGGAVFFVLLGATGLRAYVI